MRKATDTAFRYLALLQVIPVYPKKAGTAEIRQKLIAVNREYDVSVRTIQRDLDDLSASLPISSDFQGRTNHWFWSDRHSITQIPAMSEFTALALRLASDHLEPVIPTSTLRLLEPYFRRATKILQKTKLGEWSGKMHIINRGPALIPPPIDPNVQETAYAALLENKQFDVDYRGKARADTKRHTLNPLGIVFRNGIVYLVATSWEYSDPRHYAVHRMSGAVLLETPAKRPRGFDFAEYVKKSFSYPVSDGKIKLRALFSEDAALHLSESKLSEDQKITEKEGGGMLVEATVADTAELRWWLLGFGSCVEIISPRTLRTEFSELAGEMWNLYKQ